MKKIALLFLMTLIILLVGILFGYAQLHVTNEITDSTRKLSTPFEGDFDREFLEKIMPAL